MNALTQAVCRSLAAAGLAHPNARLLCAVSGGLDSVTLLHTLCLVRSEIPFTLLAVHVQHHLRGEDSLEDERFVRRLCDELGVALWVEDAGLEGSMADPGMETLAREKRRGIFARLMQEQRVDAILTAHHRDDQTETVLMHLLRGAGAQGLQGMQPAVPFGPGRMLRPFLDLPRSALEEAGYAHREDQSNREALTARNALRLTVLPEMEKWFPGASAHIAAAAQTIRTDEEALSLQAQQAYERAVYRTPPLMLLHAQALCGLPPAVVRRVLRRWWLDGLAMAGLCPQEKALSLADTLALEALISTEGSCNLPCGLMAQCVNHQLWLMRQNGERLCDSPAQEAAVEPFRQRYVFDHLTITQLPADGEKPCDAGEVILPPQLLALSPVFRSPQPDDRIHPLGAPGSKPLRRYLTDRKIPPALRPVLVVLAIGSDVLWIPSICTAQSLRVSSVSDGSVRLRAHLHYLPH